MGLFKNIKQGLDAVRNPPTPEELEAQVAQLPPEQRAAYDATTAQVAEAQAESHANWEEAKALGDRLRVLDGPAGRALYGPGPTDENSPEAMTRRMQEEGTGAFVRNMLKESMSDFGTVVKQELTGGKVAEIDDPQERARVTMEERAARDAARQPYLPPTVPPITFSRLATRGGTQVEEVAAWLQHSGLVDRPDQVYGVYRVPDRISPALTSDSEKGRVVEWDVVHEPGAVTGASGAGIDDAWFASRLQWVARRRGEASILDEDLAIAYCRLAGLGPERCLGFARHVDMVRRQWGDEDEEIRTRVTGIHVLHPAGAGGDAFDRLSADTPIPLRSDWLGGIHTEVLNADAVEAAVHGRAQDPTPVPSPFPYLPSSPQELLRMYLEVVGVRASDCYGAQVTCDAWREVFGRLGPGRTNIGPKQPCADGKERMRISAAEHVVITYRDTPEYAAGRQRWAAYQEQVLQAHLERGTSVRSPIVFDDADDVDNAVLRAGLKLAEGIDRIIEVGEGKPPPPYRYCWPTVGE
jgi:hypothetical protein